MAAHEPLHHDRSVASADAERAARARRRTDALLPSLARRYGDALRAADGDAAEAVVAEALRHGVPVAAVHDGVIRPAMVRIGGLWAHGAITVADEHVATAISHQIVAGLYADTITSRPDRARKVVLACPHGESHVLGLRMVGDVLEADGWDVLFLGRDVATPILLDALGRHAPAAVGLSCTTPAGAAGLIDLIRAVRTEHPGVAVILGGQAVPAHLADLGYVILDGCASAPRALRTALDASGAPLLPRPVRGAPAAEPRAEAATVNEVLRATEGVAEIARRYARQARDFRALAFEDPLTALPNRRAAEEHLAGLCSEHVTATVLLLDVDRFKAVNDTHGHAAGDALLVRLTSRLAEAVRPGDFLARVGGDEFLAVLDGTDSEGAVAIAERLREAAASGPDGVTVSIGLAALGPDPRACLLAADAALYEAKRAGRDRVSG